MRLRLCSLFKPLFKLFNLSESRISFTFNSCWVEVLKNREHLGKVVLKEAVGGWGFPVGCFPPCGVSPRGVWGLPPSGSFVKRCCIAFLSDMFPALWRPSAWQTSRPTTWQRLAWSCCCRPAQHAQRPRTSPTSW